MRESKHFTDMLVERGIKKEWAKLALDSPDRIEKKGDGTRHLIKRIPEFGNRWLRVIVNTATVPETLITAFFDRRVR
ncbi:MAG: DUF4258 domain-containing protein [Candidatus Fermentibacteraceae bacterium]|jgi:hypothetical protein|nr:DUF4258 domain-containing protein [Candidatus Fermentibacteraceae bacterium]